MRHVVNLKTYGQKTNTVGVHLVADGPFIEVSLCTLLKLTRTIDGIIVPVVADVTRPVTCMSCTKALEMQLRRDLRGLTVSELEDVYDHVSKIVYGSEE